MSPPAHACRGSRPHLAELALGILEGRARGGVVAHLDTCGACSLEEDRLARTADLLAELAPQRSPPAHLAEAVLARGRGSALRRRRLPRIALGALALALGLVGAGVTAASLDSSPAPRATSTTPVAVATAGDPWEAAGPAAALRAASGTSLGTVSVRGAHPSWLVVSLAAARSIPLRCVLTTTTGRVVALGTFPPSASRWAAALPVPATAAASVELTASDGSVVARAHLRR